LKTSTPPPRPHGGRPRWDFGEALTEALNYVGAEVVAAMLAPGVHHHGEVKERTHGSDGGGAERRA